MRSLTTYLSIPFMIALACASKPEEAPAEPTEAQPKESDGPFQGKLILGGLEVPASTLNRGKAAYDKSCASCHGAKGDGAGPKSAGIEPPPRDFSKAIFKFGGVPDGLPTDEQLTRVIKNGLTGTKMAAWDLQDTEIDAIVQYLKTLSERWKTEETGQAVDPYGGDPWDGKKKEAVIHGKKVYHGLAKCWDCHAAYSTRQKIFDASKEIGQEPITEFRDKLYESIESDTKYMLGGMELPILAPDFLKHDMKAVYEGSEAKDLYRTIGAGIPGTAMGAWYGVIPDEDIWAMAYYILNLTKLRGKPQEAKLREQLKNQAAFDPNAVPAAAGDEDKADKGKKSKGKAKKGKAKKSKGKAKRDKPKKDEKDKPKKGKK